MSSDIQLIPNFNMWEDAINDVHEHAKPDSFGDSHSSRFNGYFYCYLDCLHSFNDDESNYWFILNHNHEAV